MRNRDSGQGGVYQMDERWFSEWFEEGYQSLVAFLASYARFDQWCVEHPTEETP